MLVIEHMLRSVYLPEFLHNLNIASESFAKCLICFFNILLDNIAFYYMVFMYIMLH